MAVVTLLANALRSDAGQPPPEFNVPNSNPRHVRIKLTSPTFPSDPSLRFVLTVFQSFDGGQNWSEWKEIGMDSPGGLGGQPGKFGVPMDGSPESGATFDGTARRLRVTATMTPAAVWGLTADVTAT